ncbi:unnamed protein product [Darwinula stevensoni]|uniref:Protein-serine/threonine kinase n=1 Tax=Darwinula stevensoni TaxID=69355 RepID=A0A7R8X2Y4_9CRUS|nr:unnamed protein product [Darwinula stevensoni]CAG0884418.1 unnamed protein product [Darwinula stevensoni]
MWSGVGRGHSSTGLKQNVKRVRLMPTKRLVSSTPSIHRHQREERNRPRSAAFYYNQKTIDDAAAKPSVRLTPATILYAGKNSDGAHLLRSSQYLQRELPVRIAHRIAGFRTLPFVIGCNPTILSVHELYIQAFHILNEFPEIQSLEDSRKYNGILRELLDAHKDVVTHLASGFRECRRYDEDLIGQFLDRTLTSRLGIRMLAMHQLSLHDEQPNHVGIINISMKVKDVLTKWCDFVSHLSQYKYGRSATFKLSGHINAAFPYIQLPLDYILPELLKNAARATIEYHGDVLPEDMPPITITIANNDVDFIIRISDRGGGIPHGNVNTVMHYNFSTATDEENMDDHHGGFSGMVEAANSAQTAGPMYGFGFGLPTSRAYAEYLGGGLHLQSMQGIGTDVYLRLRHVDGKFDSFRI